MGSSVVVWEGDGEGDADELEEKIMDWVFRLRVDAGVGATGGVPVGIEEVVFMMMEYVAYFRDNSRSTSKCERGTA